MRTRSGRSERKATLGRLLVATSSVALIGYADYATGWEISFSILYCAPISWAAWRASRGAGLGLSVISAAIWLAADASGHPVYSHPLIPLWNAAVRLAIFVILSLQVDFMRRAIDREASLARKDPLTGVANGLAFQELAAHELARSRRSGSPTSLAYLDLDGFKGVNDRLGHLAGDALLTRVAGALRAHVRETDLVARLGGDEFVVLFPGTGEQECARAFAKVREALAREMGAAGAPVTLSAGLVTFLAPPASPDELLCRADELMYRSKLAGKNRAAHAVFAGVVVADPAAQRRTDPQRAGTAVAGSRYG